MGGYSVFHWLIVFALLGYIWLLVRIARPKPVVTPFNGSKSSLLVLTVLSWLCSLIFGVLTLAILALSANRKSPNGNSRDTAESVGYFVGAVIIPLVVPLLFALSVRWARITTRKWLAVKATA